MQLFLSEKEGKPQYNPGSSEGARLTLEALCTVRSLTSTPRTGRPRHSGRLAPCGADRKLRVTGHAHSQQAGQGAEPVV